MYFRQPLSFGGFHKYRQSLHDNTDKNDRAIQAIQSGLNNQWKKVTTVLGPFKMIVKTLKTHCWF